MVNKKKAIPRQEDFKQENFKIEIPSGSDLPERIKRVSTLTGLSNYELLRKWLAQEESTLNTSCYYAEMIQSQLQNMTEQLRDLLGKSPRSATGKTVIEKPMQKAALEDPEGHRRMLLEKMQSMKAAGMSLLKIAEQLNEEGVATISGTGKWYASTVSMFWTKNAV
ncbi:MAG: recombinase family protein [Synergistaceae bacterium]|jgi:hypothetical protein|nr:recombinase family protein [Synergistaceae bacterium]